MSNVLSKEEVNYIAKLSRLKLNENEKENFTLQLNSILEYMDKLKELDTSDIEPTSHSFKVVNVFREDKSESKNNINGLLSNAPDAENNSYKVPKIIE